MTTVNASTDSSNIPVAVNDLTDIIQVAVGDNHSVALDANGDVWVWGNNSKYQLGNGTTVNSSVPVKMTTVSGIVNISAAGNYTLAVKNDGTLWSWGEACNANLNYAISGIDGHTPGKMKYGTPSPAVTIMKCKKCCSQQKFLCSTFCRWYNFPFWLLY